MSCIHPIKAASFAHVLLEDRLVAYDELATSVPKSTKIEQTPKCGRLEAQDQKAGKLEAQGEKAARLGPLKAGSLEALKAGKLEALALKADKPEGLA
ncbi:hypothetical protein NDU88_004931 [Pleurodeles waltl]|uniref:Antifreeze protein n=1 Tax=Pleurodeles waltl TaxID=8319 RepID=A0AAV7LAW6_PLEWA|nr:hypothetical protein NDU88_004931 [Pleurodeles waltl]